MVACCWASNDAKMMVDSERTVVLVADTGNHRVRRTDYTLSTGNCVVRCLTGLCGNNTLRHRLHQ